MTSPLLALLAEMRREIGTARWLNSTDELDTHEFLLDALAWTDRLEALAVEVERMRADVIEECAKVCDARFMGDLNREDQEARRCASAIRALLTVGTGRR